MNLVITQFVITNKDLINNLKIKSPEPQQNKTVMIKLKAKPVCLRIG